MKARRRAVLVLVALATLLFGRASQAEPAYETLSVAELQAEMDAHTLISYRLTEYFLTRIEALDRRPRVR